ncbi:purine-nucleoside phosphorylase [Acetobacter oeni]|uniref:NUP-family purine nucleoside permease n=1 Tax=Acetobacter oeni TaxID=304077 RepID=A0A511XLD2_9PROT|nr:purine nucleoside permease [Acetobacter oeni]MBB3883517.1 purine nucleoside permease [Acetobacter oeni]NHO19556.1 purine nucleoside permease [Acetobacter oeni]GEN63738.1 NUP-family purine nucleoside permease [Acetobacter oeni]
MARLSAAVLSLACVLVSVSVRPAAAQPVIQPRVIVVAGWENGADSGDAPGEYQDWVEREHLSETVPVRGVPGVIFRRNDDGVYGLVLRYGSSDLLTLALDPHFDLTKTYWLFTGISGVNPDVASVGSVAWARWVVDGDAVREVDDRDIPKDWPYGLYAIGAARPDTLPSAANHYGSVTDVAELTRAYPLNQGLARWAFAISRQVRLDDDPKIAAARKVWIGYPLAQKPPFILMGETLGAERYWHGASRNLWAERWVKLWTKDAGTFVMTNEESQSNQREMRLLASRQLIDPERIMVLRSASNFDMPPPGIGPTQSMGDEGPGQPLAFDNNERAGAPVVRELATHWSRYRDTVPMAQ